MKKLFFITVLCCCSVIVNSQDIHFSQFYMSPLTLNPAMAGVNNFEGIINYKDQWRGVGTPFKTLAASVDSRLIKKQAKEITEEKVSYLSGGLNFFRDRAGDAKIGTCQVNLTMAYHLRVGKHQTLGVGIQGGYAQRSISYNDLRWANQYNNNTGYDSTLTSGEPEVLSSYYYGDVGGGIVWSLNNKSGTIHVEDNHDLKANIGVAVYHAKQKYSFYSFSTEKLYPKYVFNADALFSIPNIANIALVPGMVIYQQGPAQEMTFGTLVRYKLSQASKYTGLKKDAAIYLGVYCRLRDAIISSLLIEYSSYSIGISYDVNASKLSKASAGRGGIEVAIRYSTGTLFQKSALKTTPVDTDQ